MTATVSDAWLVREQEQADRPQRLFALPYAGGGASTYRRWAELLPGVEVVPVQLPGREERLQESAIADRRTLVTAIADALGPLTDRPYGIFGHSMGAKIAFELARELRRRGAPPPVGLFVSACRAPHLPRIPTPPVASLPDHLFAAMLARIDGTPHELLEDPAFMRTFLPTMRADFAVVDGYRYDDEAALRMPLVAFGGTQDPEVRMQDLSAWRVHTTSRFRLVPVAGGHFVVSSRARDIVEAIASELAAAAAAGAPDVPLGAARPAR